MFWIKGLAPERMSKSSLVDEEWPLDWVPLREGLIFFKSRPNKSSWFEVKRPLGNGTLFGDAKIFSFVGLDSEVCFLTWLD